MINVGGKIVDGIIESCSRAVTLLRLKRIKIVLFFSRNLRESLVDAAYYRRYGKHLFSLDAAYCASNYPRTVIASAVT